MRETGGAGKVQGGRFMRGFLAAVAASVVAETVDVASWSLGLHRHLYLMLAALFLYGHHPRVFWEYLLAGVAQMAYALTLAIGFAYLVPRADNRQVYLKGWLFGLDVWFFTYAVFGLFRIPAGQSWSTALSHAISASLYGLTLAAALRFLDARAGRRRGGA